MTLNLSRVRNLVSSVFVLRVLAFLLFLLVWIVVSELVDPILLPKPWTVADALFAQLFLGVGSEVLAGGLYGAVLQSLSILLTGYILAILYGIPVGLLMGSFNRLGKSIDVYIYALNATPRLALLPMIIVFLGLFFEAKVFIVFLSSSFPIIMNTYAGVSDVDPDLIEVGRAFGLKRLHMFRKILLPAALPFISEGLRLGSSRAVIGTIVAELFMSTSGLGFLLMWYGNTLKMANYLATVFVLVVIAITITQSLYLVERRIAPWKATEISP